VTGGGREEEGVSRTTRRSDARSAHEGGRRATPCGCTTSSDGTLCAPVSRRTTVTLRSPFNYMVAVAVRPTVRDLLRSARLVHH
jgi:hypothetical protein